MAWLNLLTKLSLLVTVAVDAAVLCHVFPAFRRSKNTAFLLIAIACVLGIVDTVYDHAADLQGISASSYIVIRTLRRFAYFADCICWGIGIVLLARPYLHSAPAEVGEDHGAHDGAANGSQPFRSDTNSTSGAAGSRP
jgi:hypothetical protein